MRTSQKRAWTTIRMNNRINDRYGLQRGTITKQKIDAYIAKWNPSEFICGLLIHSGSKISTIAKATGSNVVQVKRFLPNALESVIQNRPVIGIQPLKTPELIVFRNSLNQKLNVSNEPKKRGRKIGTKNKLNPSGNFESEQKNITHDKIIELLHENPSPKKGIVLTLPYVCTLESRIVETTDLSLNFQGYEYAYHSGVKRKSAETEEKQKLFFAHNPHMRKRMSIANADINDIIMAGISDQYAHIFADYCGTFKKNKLAIEYMLKNNLVQKGGIIWVTLSKIYDKKGFESCMKLLKKYSNYQFEKIEYEDVYTYGAMYVFILRRIK